MFKEKEFKITAAAVAPKATEEDLRAIALTTKAETLGEFVSECNTILPTKVSGNDVEGFLKKFHAEALEVKSLIEEGEAVKVESLDIQSKLVELGVKVKTIEVSK